VKIDSLADLKALIKLCRKEGLSAIEVDGVKLELGDAPVRKLKTEQQEPVNEMPQYTEDELLTWSSNG
jgi:hypothetical protein